MTSDMDGPYVTLQHVALLARKRERLLAAQVEAERQFLFAVARNFSAGNLSEIDLARIYIDYRDASATPGHSKRWAEVIPVAPNRLTRLAQNYPDGHDGVTWSGTHPLSPTDAAPLNGQPVVYLLFDPENTPCYVGSTNRLRHRLKAHSRDGKLFVAWQAHACRDRMDAYRVEREWLREYKPYLNRTA